MIISSSKPFEEVLAILKDEDPIFVVGCSVCAAKLHVGGEPEVKGMCERLARAGKHVIGGTVPRAACNMRSSEVLTDLDPEILNAGAILVMSCGSGASTIAKLFDIPVYPSNNTDSLGGMSGDEVLRDQCVMCGQCSIGDFGGVCPSSKCPKGLLNGPCGGSMDGKCEVDPEKDCAWELIYERLERIKRLDLLENIYKPKEHGVK